MAGGSTSSSKVSASRFIRRLPVKLRRPQNLQASHTYDHDVIFEIVPGWHVSSTSFKFVIFTYP